MKKAFLLLLFFSPSLFANTWYTDFETAQKVAIATNKLIVVDFWADWCGPCKKMDRDVWNDEEVKTVLNDYVPLRLDFDTQKRLSMQYGVRGIPYVVIIDPNGIVFHNSLGYTNKIQTMKVLEKFRLNTSFMQTETAYYHRSPSYSTALRLAQKYLDFSLHVDNNVRNEILDVSRNYLAEADKLLDSKQTNFNMVSQKIELMEANADLYSGNYRKLERTLNKKIDEENLRKYNWGMYCFLNYCLYLEKDDKENINKWEEELNNLKNPKAYKTRIANLLATRE